MYWTETFLGDADIFLILKGSNAQTERVHLQQSKRPPRFWRRAKYVILYDCALYFFLIISLI